MHWTVVIPGLFQPRKKKKKKADFQSCCRVSCFWKHEIMICRYSLRANSRLRKPAGCSRDLSRCSIIAGTETLPKSSAMHSHLSYSPGRGDPEQLQSHKKNLSEFPASLCQLYLTKISLLLTNQWPTSKQKSQMPEKQVSKKLLLAMKTQK